MLHEKIQTKCDICVMFDDGIGGFHRGWNWNESLLTNAMELKIAAGKSIKILYFLGILGFLTVFFEYGSIIFGKREGVNKNIL